MMSLDAIDVARPCPASWSEMRGDDRVRHCGACAMNVYNVEGLTRDEALALVHRAEGGERVCVRFHRRADGTVLTRDCPVGVRTARRRALALAGRAAAVLLLALGTLAGSSGCSRTSRARQVEPLKSIMNWFDPPPPMSHIAGRIAAPPRPQPPPIVTPLPKAGKRP